MRRRCIKSVPRLGAENKNKERSHRVDTSSRRGTRETRTNRVPLRAVIPSGPISYTILDILGFLTRTPASRNCWFTRGVSATRPILAISLSRASLRFWIGIIRWMKFGNKFYKSAYMKSEWRATRQTLLCDVMQFLAVSKPPYLNPFFSKKSRRELFEILKIKIYSFDIQRNLNAIGFWCIVF